MTQPDLFSVSERRQTKAVNVPASSALAALAVDRDGRKWRIARALGRYWKEQPTSAELAAWMSRGGIPTTDGLLYVRRGLSDALAAGLVEHSGKRMCAVSGKTALTWKVRSR